jgi:hypothetical protein
VKAKYLESHKIVLQVSIRNLFLKKNQPILPYEEIKFER